MGTLTVAGCCEHSVGGGAHACDVVRTDIDHFAYGGGHFQKYATDLGLGSATTTTLATKLQQVLGSDLPFAYSNPGLAGGLVLAPADYGKFLRKILKGELAIHDHLGEQAVCTLPGTCPGAHGSPVPEAWHYSYGHWVEDDPTTGDGSFSSPGLFGTYPWIDATKKRYGIVARKADDHLQGKPEDTAYWKSVICGRKIRKTFMTANPM